MKKLFLTMLLISAMVLASVGMATAESILFPYIANTANNLDTIISVINTNANVTVPFLHYRYFTKSAGVAAEHTVACNEYNFSRPTTQNDLVTFAVGRTAALGGGNAMFNDSTNYNAGGGTPPNFGHDHGSGRYGVLVVTTALTPLADTAVNDNTTLDGEASLYDIATGAMWGYKAIPSNADAGAATTENSFAFATSVSAIASGTAAPSAPRIVIYPPNQFTGRLFVTPLNFNGNNANNNFLNAINLSNTTVNFAVAAGTLAVFNRNEDPVSHSGSVGSIRCTARLNLTDITGGAALSPLRNGGDLYTQGGWAYLQVDGGLSVAVHDLKFGNVTGMSGMVNDGKRVYDLSNR